MVALSSGEAELYALRSGTTGTMGVLQFLRESDVKIDADVPVVTDYYGEVLWPRD